MLQQFWLAEPYRARLAAMGLQRFEDFIDNPVGQIINRESDGTRLICRLTLPDGEILYLKSICLERPRQSLKPLLLAHRPMAEAMREYQLLLSMQSAGFTTMEPVGVGQEWRRLHPERSFLLVKQVPGLGGDAFVANAPLRQQRQFMRDWGQLTARLHQAGFFLPVRLNDLICSPQPEAPANRLVLIDRETNRWWSQRVSMRRRIGALARTYRRSQLVNPLPKRAWIAFLQGYCQETKSHGLPLAFWMARILAQANREK